MQLLIIIPMKYNLFQNMSMIIIIIILYQFEIQS